LGKQAVDEKFLLKLAAFFEWHLRRGFHGTDGGNRREQTALFFSSCLSRGRKDSHVVGHVSELFIALTRLGGGPSGDLAGKRNRSGEEIAFDEAVDDAEFSASSALTGLPLVHIDGFATPASLGRRCVPRRAGDKAELYFRLADLCGEKSNAIVAAIANSNPPQKAVP